MNLTCPTRRHGLRGPIGASVLAALVCLLAASTGGGAQTLVGGPSTNPVQAAANEWPVGGGNIGNQRYSSLDQINTINVQNLKGRWVAHTGSATLTRYRSEAAPVMQNGVLYVITGNDDVFAFDARTGQERWEYRSGLDLSISTVCCGWSNRGVAVGDGLVFAGRLDGSFMALDQQTGLLEWQTQVGRWQDGYTITSAPLYANGVVYTGVSGGEKGIRGKLTALEAKTGQELWHFWTVPGPDDFGGDTWPTGADAYTHGGGAIWSTPTFDPDLGLIYFSTGNPGPGNDGSVRPGDNLFTVSIVALHLDGSYAWHFQQVHHDIWDYDAGSNVVLFDSTLNGRAVKALEQPGKTGWLYLLDRSNGKPLVGIDEKPVPQALGQASAATQPYPVGDAVTPQCAGPLPNWISACIFDTFDDISGPKLFAPSGDGGVDGAPSSYDPQTDAVYVAASYSPITTSQKHQAFTTATAGYQGQGTNPPAIGAPRTGTLSGVDVKTNKLIWHVDMPYAIGSGSGATTSAGGLLWHGEPDGNLQAYDARTGTLLWQWQTGAGIQAPPSLYAIDGVQYVAVLAGGPTGKLADSTNGDAVWVFSLDGNLAPFGAPEPPLTSVGGFETRAITATNRVTSVDFAFMPNRVQIKAGDTLTFTNNGPQPHTATSHDGSGFDTGLLGAGASYALTFDQPGTYVYNCTPHPYMVGQIRVADADGNVPETAPNDPDAVHP